MKWTQYKDFFRTVRRNLASFLVIAVLFAAAIAMYCGGDWICTSSNLKVISTMDEGNTALLEYVFPYGADEDDLETLTGGQEELYAEGYNVSYRYYVVDGNRYQAKIMSMMDSINTFVEVEGTLPKKDGEIAVRKYWADKNGVKIGDTIFFEESHAQTDVLVSDTFKVTALVESTAYLPIREDLYGTSAVDFLPVNCIMFVAPEAMDNEVIGGYTNVCITSREMRGGDLFSEEFKEKEEKIENRLSYNAQDVYQKGYDRIVKAIEGLPEEMKEELMPEDVGYYTFLLSESSITFITTIIQNIFDKVRFSLTALFVIVSMFVSYSTISRMVYDHTRLIGMKTANGMRQGEIFRLYLSFTLLALLLGMGVSLGIAWLYETVIHVALKAAWVCWKADFYFGYPEFVTIAAVMIVFAVLVTVISVRKVLSMRVTEQLAGETPIVGKNRFFEKWGVWKRLPLLSKTIVNNFFNDKRRVIGTILGVTGSTALIIASFTFSNLVLSSYNLHFDNYYHFDHLLRFRSEEGVQEEVAEVLEDYDCVSAPVFIDTFYYITEEDEQMVATLYVYAEDTNFPRLVEMKDRNDRILGKGIYFSHAVAEEYNLKADDAVKIKDSSGEEHEFAVDGFFTDYLFEGVAFCDLATYEKLFGKTPEMNGFLTNIGDADGNDMQKELMKIDDFVSMENYKEKSDFAFQAIRFVMLMMMLVFLFVAMGMAVMVLVNLINVYIAEKKRDLIIIIINGYDTAFAKKYIYSDTIALTVVGVLFGSVVGELFGNVTAQSFASFSCNFRSGIDPWGILSGVAIMAVLVFGICYVSLKKIDTFRLIDINQ